MRRPLLALTAALSLTLAACGGTADTTQSTDDGATETTATETTDAPAVEASTIVVTTSILGDLVEQITQGDADVEVLMGPGVDPHAFQPSAAQAASLRSADLVIANGLQLEESLIDTLEAAEEDGATVFEVAPAVDPIAYEEGEGHDDHGDEDHSDEDGDEDHGDEDHGDEDHSDEDEDHGEHGDEDHSDEDGDEDHGDEDHSDEDEDHGEHEHGEFDPHVWQDAGRMAEAAELIADAIADVDDTMDDDEWAARGEALRDELVALDAELAETLAVVEQRELITNHEAFGYFADAYDFTILDTVVPGASTQVDTSAGDFVELVELLQDEGITTIFAETVSSDRLAEALAAEVGSDVQIVPLVSDALGEDGSGAETYQGMMRTNAQLIVDALA